jgi:hypothetical protein
MAIQEKATQLDDLYLHEIFRNPVLFIEFMYNYDLDENNEPIELTWYQKQFVCDFSSYVSIMAGRASGKTFSLVGLLLWILVNRLFQGDYIVYFVPNKVHLEPVWAGLQTTLRVNSLMKQFISPNTGINNGDHVITLLNGAVLMARIAGTTGTGANVVGLHTPFFIVDESGYQPWGSWIELQPTINTFTPGFRLMVAGVPDGRREKSVCYHCDSVNSSYSKHRVSSDMNPRLTKEDRLKAIEDYGGEDSDDFIHLWLAEHGKPVFSLFDRGTMQISQNPVYRLTINGAEGSNDLDFYKTKLALLPGVEKNTDTVIGIDLGYTEPTAIFIMTIDDYDRLKFFAKIEMSKVSYPIQEKLIDYLDTKFSPLFLGIDKGAGGQGISVVQHLTDDIEYAHKDYSKRLIPIDFSTSIVIGMDADGKELKSRAKPLAVSVLQEMVTNHKIVFSSTDLETISELERMTYTKSVNGDIAYRTITEKGGKKGADHFTSALLVLALAYYLQTEFIKQKKKSTSLFKVKWLG